jgi:RNA polymerase sigma-54 factor
MKQSIQLRLGQNLTMTPQLQQAIRLLQLSTVELNMEVQQALESNMMLEIDEEEDATTRQDDLREAPPNAEGSEVPEPKVTDTSEQIPNELPVDSAWDDIYDGSVSYAGTSQGVEMEFENQRGPAETLKDQMSWQTNVLPMTETDRVIAMAIVDAINADGYLSCNLEDIREALGVDAELEVDLDEIEVVLHRLQQLDPPGIAARDLRECLALQMAQCDPDTPWLTEAKKLVEEYLELLAARDYNQLMRRMKLSTEELQQVVAVVQSMNPRPGAQMGSSQVEYVTPDVFVRKKKGVWHVELNQETIPHVRVNPYYASMIRRADKSPDNNSLKAHLQEARWFIKSLQSRSETLLRVATAIVERQRGFLDYGEEAMKPLVLHDIAEVLGMHESTISRVTTRKYIHTPRGIFELKYFFSSHVSTTAGDGCSSTAIRAVIKKLIAAENPIKPLSDSKIAKLLSEQGIRVARRTVAKYREGMTIPPSNERKRLA